MNIENLKKLADFLEVKVKNSAFDMDCFVGINYRELPEFVSQEDYILNYINDKDATEYSCGTVACALGYAPLALDLSGDDIIKSTLTNKETYNSHWERISEEHLGIGFSSVEWDWCFSDSWSEIDNTPLGASMRINHLIEKGSSFLYRSGYPISFYDMCDYWDGLNGY